MNNNEIYQMESITMEEISKSQGLDDQLEILKEKRKMLLEISSKLQDLKKQKKNIQKKEPKNKIKENSTKPSKKPQASSKKDLDQDRLSLTKQEILEFCDRILAQWNKDPSKDSKHIFAMNAVKTSVLWTDEETLREIWGEILKWAFDLLYRNAIAQAKEENLEWSHIMEKLGNS